MKAKKRRAIIKCLREFQAEIKRKISRPSVRAAARREWRRHINDLLKLYEKGYSAGRETAMWDAILFCDQTSTSKPVWLRGAMEQYAKDRINRKPLTKQKEGRPSNILRDLHIADSVDYYRGEQILFGKKGKARRFSYPRCFEMVRRELANEGTNLSVHTIKKAYGNGKRLWKCIQSGDYVLSPFSEK